MNIKTKALEKEQYELIIATIRNGFTYDNGKEFKPNNRLATALVVQANLGCRISDILKLTLSDIVKECGRYRLDIIEQKTGKKRDFTVPTALYNYLVKYAEENHIGKQARLFPVGERAVQKQLKIVTDYFGFESISTHSFRKFYGTEIYYANDCDIELVRQLYQHSSTAVTQQYIGVSNKRIDNAINKHLCIA